NSNDGGGGSGFSYLFKPKSAGSTFLASGPGPGPGPGSVIEAKPQTPSTSAENFRELNEVPRTPVHKVRQDPIKEGLAETKPITNGTGTTGTTGSSSDSLGSLRKPNKKGRTVQFPPESEMVTGYLEPMRPHFHQSLIGKSF